MIVSAIRHVREQKLREKDRLAEIGTAAAVFAHEIANPLGSIRIAAQAITELLPAEDQKLCEILVAEIDRLVVLLEEFRSLSTVKNVKLASLDLVRVLDRVLEMNSAAWLTKGVQTVRHFPASLELQGDDEKIQQAVLNLCKNAVESMPTGGTLTLRAARRGKYIAVEVQDTGHGIPEGVDVFKLFDTTKSKGAGIGLYVVRQIVEAHHGRVSYKTDASKGTTFRVQLPVCRIASA